MHVTLHYGGRDYEVDPGESLGLFESVKLIQNQVREARDAGHGILAIPTPPFGFVLVNASEGVPFALEIKS